MIKLKSSIKILVLIIFTIFFILLLQNKVLAAASANITSNYTTMQVTESAKISVSVTNAAGWDLAIKESGGDLSGEKSILYEGDGYLTETSKTVSTLNFTAKTAGTYTITLSGMVSGSDLKKQTISKPITIKVIDEVKPEENTINNENNNTNNSNNVISGNNNSSNSSSSVPKSSDATIKSLTAQTNGNNINVSSSSNKYSSTVESNVNSVVLTIKTNSSKATIDSNMSTSGVGFIRNSASNGEKTYTISNLKEGTNVVKIDITAENGSVNNYTFSITKKIDESKKEDPVPNIIDDKKEDENISEDKDENTDKDSDLNELGLKSLEVKGIELTPKFVTDIYTYSAKVKNKDSVEVIALPTFDDAIVEVVGNTSLGLGENLITILVKKENETKTYQIILTKEEGEDEVVNAVIEEVESNEDNSAVLKNVIIIVAGALLAIGIIIKLATMSMKEDDDDLETYEEEGTDNVENEKVDTNDNIVENDLMMEDYVQESEKTIKKPKKGKRYK